MPIFFRIRTVTFFLSSIDSVTLLNHFVVLILKKLGTSLKNHRLRFSEVTHSHIQIFPNHVLIPSFRKPLKLKVCLQGFKSLLSVNRKTWRIWFNQLSDNVKLATVNGFKQEKERPWEQGFSFLGEKPWTE